MTRRGTAVGWISPVCTSTRSRHSFGGRVGERRSTGYYAKGLSRPQIDADGPAGDQFPRASDERQSTSASGVEHTLVARKGKGRNQAVANALLAHEARPQHDRREEEKDAATKAAPVLSPTGTGLGLGQARPAVAANAKRHPQTMAAWNTEGASMP